MVGIDRESHQPDERHAVLGIDLEDLGRPKKFPQKKLESGLSQDDMMKKKRFMEEQIIGILREQETSVKAVDLARKYPVSETTPYNWKAKFGGMDISEAKRPGRCESWDQSAGWE
jgi:putative transposase